MPSGVRRLLFFALLAACGPKAGETETKPPSADAPAGDPLAIYEALEAKIAEGKDSEKDRVAALGELEAIADDGTAGYAFARAALTGRVAENRGAKAG